MLREITMLVAKDFKLEFRTKSSISAMLLYVISTIFVCYLSFKRIVDIPTWNALFWNIMLFASINTISKGFVGESKGRLLYQYSLHSPQSIILSKIIYHTILLIVLSILCYIIYSLVLENPVQNNFMFFCGLVIGTMGFASTFTMISAIASKTNNNISLVAVLGFPIILPLLITLIAFSKAAIDGLAWSVSGKYLIVLSLLNVIIITLSFLLFPYLWRD